MVAVQHDLDRVREGCDANDAHLGARDESHLEQSTTQVADAVSTSMTSSAFAVAVTVFVEGLVAGK